MQKVHTHSVNLMHHIPIRYVGGHHVTATMQGTMHRIPAVTAGPMALDCTLGSSSSFCMAADPCRLTYFLVRLMLANASLILSACRQQLLMYCERSSLSCLACFSASLYFIPVLP